METITGVDISAAAELLMKGNTVAIPTETVYGLAANALNEEAVLNIFKVKNRPTFDPLIVHIHDSNVLGQYVESFPDPAHRLMEAFWPGPLTILFRKKSIIPDLVTSGLPDVAVRMPSHPMTRQLLQLLPFPLAAPSANPFGYISPTTAAHVADQLQGKIPYILDGGASNVGIESTIVGFENDSTVIYRLGGISIEQIKNVTGKLQVQINSSSDPKAPGMLKSHYAPAKPLYTGTINELALNYKADECAVILFEHIHPLFEDAAEIIILSPNGNIEEAARNLFAALRQADSSKVKTILVETVPGEGLGAAINDRLRRAAVTV
jgi:L-threonylcarbamoyladenylate synthase